MRFDTPGGPLDIDIAALIVAGWTARDGDAVSHHIAELATLGVAPPSAVPLFYRVSRSLLTQAPAIEVLGPATSGEVEPIVIQAQGQLWLGLGSDHTDRELEAISVAASKQACPKPVSTMLWPMAEVAGHIDRLVLRCHVREDGQDVLYQHGTLAAIRPLDELVTRSGLGDGGAMLCGTLAAIGGVRPAADYSMELHDPVRDRTIALAYSTASLPQVA